MQQPKRPHSTSRWAHRRPWAWAMALGLAAAACGSGQSFGEGGDAGASGGADSDGPAAGKDDFLAQCAQACDAGQFCSQVGECIGEGTCAHDDDCEAGLECDVEGERCRVGSGCGAQEITITSAPPPNLLMVLDRSCSMRRNLNNKIATAGPNKWTYSVAAINSMLSQFNAEIRFGLTLFPDTQGGKCGQGAPAVAVGASNENTISNLLTATLSTKDANYPDGPCVTNIDSAMHQASIEPAFKDTSRASYALLITDGKQAGCSRHGGNAGTTKIIKQLRADGIPTFVLGFGGAVSVSKLGEFAAAGGAQKAGSTPYYQADNLNELKQALDTIAKTAIGCSYDLSAAPESADQISVFFNSDPKAIPRDPSHKNGWDYDASNNQINFYGAACDDLQSDTVSDIDIVHRCSDALPTPD